MALLNTFSSTGERDFYDLDTAGARSRRRYSRALAFLATAVPSLKVQQMEQQDIRASAAAAAQGRDGAGGFTEVDRLTEEDLMQRNPSLVLSR